MSVVSLDAEKNSDIESLIAVCKSNSEIHGLRLREAHYELGKILAKRMSNDLPSNDITIIIMMRAGLCFGMGVADELEALGINVSILFYFNNNQWNNEKNNCTHALANDIILIDAVINTGDSIIRFAQSVQNDKTIFFVSNVLSEKAVDKFRDKFLYTTRISENSFKGSKLSVVKDGKGPDTGDRLFIQYEFT